MECRRGLAMRIMSVRLSNACIVTKRKKDLSIFLYHTKDHLAELSEKKNGWWGWPLLPKIFGSTGPRWSEIPDFEPIFARSASAVTPSDKSSINTNRRSTAYFPMSLRWSPYVAPRLQRGSQKRKTAVIRLKSHFAWKSATTFLCVKNVSDKVVRHSLA